MADKKPYTLEFANFTCKFGEKNLLDFAKDIVIPAFFSTEKREYGKSRLFFENVEIVKYDTEKGPIVCLQGRFIKVTTLTREQIYVDGKGLIKAPAELETAPSSIFMLVLNNHKLLYLKENPHAPGIFAFRSTAHYYIRKKYSEFLNRMMNEFIEEAQRPVIEKGQTPKRVTKRERLEIIKKLREVYPDPTLQIIPMASSNTIGTFIKQYKTLKEIKIKFNRTNDELSFHGFFSKIEEGRDALNSENTTLIHGSSTGLAIDKSVEFLTPIAEEGNQEISLDGVDKNGNRLRGNNDEFNFKATLFNITRDVDDTANRMYNAFGQYVNDGVIKADFHPSEKVIKKLIEIDEEYFDE